MLLFCYFRKEINEFITSDREEFPIENRNGFQRKLIYQLIETKFRDIVSTESRNMENNRRALVVRKKLSPEQEKILAVERLRNSELELQDLIGITTVMKLISESRKLIVGHNMLLDVIYILRQCFGATPDNYNQFKQMTRHIFPKYDNVSVQIIIFLTKLNFQPSRHKIPMLIGKIQSQH